MGESELEPDEVVRDIHVVDDGFAWLLTSRTIYFLTGGFWGGGRGSSGDATRIVGDRGLGLGLSEDNVFENLGWIFWRPVANIPAGTYTTIWTHDPDAFWVGTEEGQLLLRQSGDWRSFETGPGSILGLWGMGDSVYFFKETSFGRAVAGRIEILASWSSASGMRLRAIDGNGETGEVFLALEDRSFAAAECGHLTVAVYDGISFRRI